MKCNLRCGYCYEFLRNGTAYCHDDMSIERLCSIVQRTARLFPGSKVLWMFHGGEPLLRGSHYLSRFADCVRRVNKTYATNHYIALQTNATLLSEEYIQVLEKNADLLSERIVSISIDGPREQTDLTRRFADGSSPFSQIETAISKVKASSLSFSVISVVGTHNVEQPQAIFTYLKNIGANLCKFVPNYNSDAHGNPEKYGIRPMDFAQFMCKIFDLWMRDLPTPKKTQMVIDPIVSIICNLSHAPVMWCEYREEKCSNFTCIYPNGEMWLCDNFLHESMRQNAYVKNVFEVSDEEFKEILLTPNKKCHFETFYQEEMSRCAGCEAYSWCKGGCLPTHYEMRRKSEALFSEYCEAKKILIQYIKRGVDIALS